MPRRGVPGSLTTNPALNGEALRWDRTSRLYMTVLFTPIKLFQIILAIYGGIKEGVRRALAKPSSEFEVMRRKSAFVGGHFWENFGLLVFFVAGLTGLVYVVTNVISW